MFRNNAPNVPVKQKQAEASAKAAEVDAFREQTKTIDWHRTDRYWRAVDGNVMSFDEMEDAYLWGIINWLVNNRYALFRTWASTLEKCFGDNAWLAQKENFKQLVIEAAKRGLTFPPATFNYIRDHVASLPSRKAAVTQATPWRDENLRTSQRDVMDRLAGNTPEPYEKEFRSISLE